jgi:hypothetical protein
MSRGTQGKDESRRGFLKRAGVVGGIGALGGFQLLAEALARGASQAPGREREFGPGNPGRTLITCSETYTCTETTEGRCSDNHYCGQEMFGCTQRVFNCENTFQCDGPGGGHNCTWHVKFFCDQDGSGFTCTPPAHYHNCAWPHGQPIERIQPQPGG